tara:strand:+ start:2554 stop:3501 length:948 start_codon:yes stop_codon:yes gene_type:complete
LHKYFIIPVIIFFIIIALIVFYLQFIDQNWKYGIIGKSVEEFIPKICNDENEIKIISHPNDKILNRSFKDKPDTSSDYKFHGVYLLPCNQKDRKFDINKNINYSLQTINKWFFDKTKDKIINFDKTKKGEIDITFIRVNKTINWFTKFNTNENKNLDTGSKIENIIKSNSNLFNNFDKKKFIVFFEGWEKRRSLTNEFCGLSRYNGKVAIFFTNAKSKKNKSCTNDNINDSIEEIFGKSESTILHEMLHTLGVPPRCANNLDNKSSFHVSDNKNDIMNEVSGSMYLDYNNDDYYNHNIKNCEDLADNKYLIYKKY